VALEKAGGYYFSTGGSEMIANGDIKVKQGEIASFGTDTEVTFKDGSKENFDVIVFATGYTGFPDTIRETIGGNYAETFNPVWGLDEEGEIRGVARESGIPNFFFLVGNLSACRMSSKVLALQIKAQRLGIFGERCEWSTLWSPAAWTHPIVCRHLREAEAVWRPVRQDRVPRYQWNERTP
jgi:hypothetical protein